jgi:hypothetical protein
MIFDYGAMNSECCAAISTSSMVLSDLGEGDIWVSDWSPRRGVR